MKERPILFNGPMVRALLNGTKTQTRRVAKSRKHPDAGCDVTPGELAREQKHVIDRSCPYGQPGERLWVRETWMDLQGTGVEVRTGDRSRYAYGADTPPGSYGDEARKDYGLKWRPSIHMPRCASRITLEVTGISVERLQDISKADAIAEGVYSNQKFNGMWTGDGDLHTSMVDGPIRAYQMLWESINGPGSWDANPWVWVVEFKRKDGQA